MGEGATAHRLVLDGQSISSSSVQSANNKMPVSSVFNDSEGLYRTTVCLVRKPHYSAQQMRFGSRVRAIFFSQIRHRNALTEIAWEDGDVQGLGMAMSTVTSEKNRELLFTGNVFYKQWHLCLFREHDLLKISNINPGKEARFSLWKKLVHRESGRNGA